MASRSPKRSLDQSRTDKTSREESKRGGPSRNASIIKSKLDSSRSSNAAASDAQDVSVSSATLTPALIDEVDVASATGELLADVVETQLAIPQAPEEQKADTFVTEAKQDDRPPEQAFLVNDLLFPGGKVSKLVKCR
jgi:hypothetical protein